ncbi:hypothetical protein DVH24_016059 [Malus domestica]|uniref:Uncharacterized protein n=1 Tax=Malus domestica TaxID=3750 RepID=A0A498JK25_MALDO|nr:hypothetical protein DVH24_016059 [Malus domestica]
MAQLRAGRSIKSKLTIVKFKTLESVDGWEVRQGTYFQDVVASKYEEEWMPSSKSFSPAVFSAFTFFGSDPRPVNAIFAFSNGATKLEAASQNEIHGIFLIINYKIWLYDILATFREFEKQAVQVQLHSVDDAIWAAENATLKAEMSGRKLVHSWNNLISSLNFRHFKRGVGILMVLRV